jgi:hypothetical protein
MNGHDGQPGGQANIYGIRYQILGSIARASQLDYKVRYRLRAEKRSGNILKATLILEPPSGGDIEYHDGVVRTVEQWKSRAASQPAWRLREIIKKILPDLFKATDVDGPTRYRFVSEGPVTDISAFADFCGRLSPALRSVTELDDERSIQFFPKVTDACTERELVLYVMEQVRLASKPAGSLTEEEMLTRTVRMLVGFEFQASLSMDELNDDIDRFLKSYLHSHDDLEAKRNEVCGIVLEMATRKENTFTPDEFLVRAGLKGHPVQDFRSLHEALDELWHRDAEVSLQYDESLDVRSAHKLSDRVTLVTGESGHGKTWGLAAVGHEAATDGLVVLARARGTRDSVLQAISDTVWQRGYGRQSPIAIAAMARNIRDAIPKLPASWLTVIIDDVASSELACDLLEYNWGAIGVRLVVSVPEQFAKSLTDKYQKDVGLIEIPQFTPVELREYLKRRGLDAGALPPDMREFLRLPLLSQLYADLSGSEGAEWNPESEYVVFQSAWARLRMDVRQLESPSDASSFLELIKATVRAKAHYPWSAPTLLSFGLDSDAIRRLTRIGWLKRDGTRIRVWHDRLLNWAVAEALADEFLVAGDQSLPLIREVLDPASKSRPFGTVGLGYVAMDLLWLISGVEYGSAGTRAEVLSAVVDLRYSGYTEKTFLFRDMVPTLGPRVLPVLGEYFDSRNAEFDGIRTEKLRVCLREIAKFDRVGFQQAALSLLPTTNLGTRLAVAAVLKSHPMSEACDAGWTLLQEVREALSSGEDEKKSLIRFHDQNVTRLVSRCARLNTNWLSQRIGETSDPGLLGTLAKALARSDSSDAGEVWQANKSHFLTCLPDGDLGVVECIERFRDLSETHRLCKWAGGKPSWISMASFAALSVVCPDSAITLAPEVDPSVFIQSSATAIPEMLDFDEPRTRALLLRLLSTSQEKTVRYSHLFSMRFSRLTYVLDEKMLNLIFSTLEALLREKETTRGEWSLLELLSFCCERSHVPAFHSHRGEPFESLLTAKASEWVRDNDRDQCLKFAIKVLMRIGGCGFTQVVNEMLSSDSRAMRRDGLEWSTFAPDETTIKLIYENATFPESDSESIPVPWILRKLGRERLAFLWQNRLLVQALLETEFDVFEVLHSIGGHASPMNDEEIEPSVRALLDDNLPRAAQVLGITGRRDLIPTLLEVGESVDPDTKLGLGSIIGLCGLRADCGRSLALYARHLELNPNSHRYIATTGLFAARNSEARQILIEHLQSSFRDQPFSSDDRLAAALVEYPDTREAATELLKQHVSAAGDFRNIFRSRDHLKVFSQLEDEETDEFIRNAADPAEGGFHTTGRRADAIEALSKRDAEAAYEAAVRGLKFGKCDREFYPSILIDLDSTRAVRLLWSAYGTETKVVVRRAIGLAIRRSAEDAIVRELVAEGLSAESSNERCATIELSEWLPPNWCGDAIRSALETERCRG